MLKKTILIVLLGATFLLLPSLIHAEKHVAVPAAAFHPATDGEDYMIWSTPCMGHYLIKYSTPGVLIAPVYFPQERGEILAMKVLVQDEIKDGLMSVALCRTRLTTGEVEVVYEILTEDHPGKVIMITDNPYFDWNKFDNREYAWYVQVVFYESVQGLRFYNVQLVYK